VVAISTTAPANRPSFERVYMHYSFVSFVLPIRKKRRFGSSVETPALPVVLHHAADW
jgi:hypothetical protein